MNRPACIFSLLFLGWLSVVPTQAANFEAQFSPGARLDVLPVGPVIYHRVEIRSVNAHTLVILHEGGLASIRLRDLAPEWQARFHYDTAADLGAASLPSAPIRPLKVAASPTSSFDALLEKFGQPAAISAEVDLRPRFFQLELGVKNQGRRPSCAIFAVVSALEFQNAQLVGHAEKFSEEYLIWAVRKTVQHLPAARLGATDDASAKDEDEGFSLPEVVAALRIYGIPLQSSMPNTFGRKIEAIEEPSAAIIQEARNHKHVFVHLIPGRDAASRLNNIIQALNAGVPIAIGLGWPNYRTLRGGYLSGQKPLAGSGHAVTLVGYKSPTNQIADTVFIFKNSYGPEWGQGGYGTVTYGYLQNNLQDAVLLEVQPG